MFDLDFIERLLDEAEEAPHVVRTAEAEEAADGSRQFATNKRKRASDDSTATDQARRDDCTVLILGLHPSTDERAVYEYFSREAGKVRDIQVIRDGRTGKNKGVAYVEFFMPDSILKAMACNGQLLKGVPIRVQSAQAEKNRAEATSNE
jgi:RNA-binding protein 23/39